MPRDRREWPLGTVRVHWHPFCCDLQPRRLRSRFRAKNLCGSAGILPAALLSRYRFDLLPTLSEGRERKLSGNMPNRASNMLTVPKSEGIQCEIFENSRWIGFSEDDGRSIGDQSPKAQILAAEPHCCQRVEDNAFHLKNNYGVPHAHEVFHARGVPVREADATVARSAANCLRIIRAVNTDAGFVQAHP